MRKINIPLPERIASLRDNSYFSIFDDTILENIAEKMQLYLYKPDEIVSWQGEECSGLFTIRKGSVKLFKLSPRARELIINVLTEGATFNEVPVFDGKLNVVNVAALEESEIWLVDKQVVRRLLNERPEFSQQVVQKLSQNLRRMIRQIEDLSFHQVTNRLARLLVQLSKEQLEGQPGQRLTRDQLASRLGTVREVVSRSLHELERSGAICLNRRQIIIADRTKLEEWAHEV